MIRTVNSILHSNPSAPQSQAPKAASITRSASPALSASGRKSPYQMPSRIATTPLPVKVSSPDLSISQDCAFPPFPTSRSRSATPTTPSDSSFPFPHRNRPVDPDPHDIEPLPPRTPNSAITRKNTTGSPPPGNKGDVPSTSNRKSSSSSGQDFVRPTSSGSTASRQRRPSTSSSNYTRNPSVSSTAGSSRFTLERSKTAIPAVPSVPQQIQNDRPDDDSKTRNGHQLTDPGFDFGSFGQDNRSQTFPTPNRDINRSEEQASFHRRPSEPSVRTHKPKPSVAAAVMQPLHEIGSTSSFKPSKSLRGRNQNPQPERPPQSKNVSEARDEHVLPIASPLPGGIGGGDGSRNPYHTPHESTSSNESYSSGAKTGSSRSSPPLNESPLRSMVQLSDDGPINNLFNGFHFGVDRRPSFEEPAKISRPEPIESSKSRPVKPPASARPTIPTLPPLEQPPPTNQTFASSDQYLVSPLTPSPITPQSDNLHHSPAPLAPPLAPPSRSGAAAPRPRTANKGNCRGCGELIKGKSVSSADGRLTGRYHKQCFVCKTCQAPFQTADFYVMHNHPYCARHYHELNDSLCKNCDRGIEGQYLETDKKLKFHPHCFSCQECHRILRDDYFEWNGRTLCEQHAFRAAQQPSSLGPGRRYPERRTTRLMMM